MNTVSMLFDKFHINFFNFSEEILGNYMTLVNAVFENSSANSLKEWFDLYSASDTEVFVINPILSEKTPEKITEFINSTNSDYLKAQMCNIAQCIDGTYDAPGILGNHIDGNIIIICERHIQQAYQRFEEQLGPAYQEHLTKIFWTILAHEMTHLVEVTCLHGACLCDELKKRDNEEGIHEAKKKGLLIETEVNTLNQRIGQVCSPFRLNELSIYQSAKGNDHEVITCLVEFLTIMVFSFPQMADMRESLSKKLMTAIGYMQECMSNPRRF